MNNLKLIPHDITGMIHIKENSQFNNIESEMVILSENVKVRLFGRVEDIVLKKGSCVYIHGVVTGNIENHGGVIHIFHN